MHSDSFSKEKNQNGTIKFLIFFSFFENKHAMLYFNTMMMRALYLKINFLNMTIKTYFIEIGSDVNGTKKKDKSDKERNIGRIDNNLL